MKRSVSEQNRRHFVSPTSSPHFKDGNTNTSLTQPPPPLPLLLCRCTLVNTSPLPLWMFVASVASTGQASSLPPRCLRRRFIVAVASVSRLAFHWVLPLSLSSDHPRCRYSIATSSFHRRRRRFTINNQPITRGRGLKRAEEG